MTNIIKTPEQVELDTGINVEDYASDLRDFAHTLLGLAEYLDGEAELDITYLDDTQTSLTCGDMTDELSILAHTMRRLLSPYQDQLLSNYLDAQRKSA